MSSLSLPGAHFLSHIGAFNFFSWWNSKKEKKIRQTWFAHKIIVMPCTLYDMSRKTQYAQFSARICYLILLARIGGAMPLSSSRKSICGFNYEWSSGLHWQVVLTGRILQPYLPFVCWPFNIRKFASWCVFLISVIIFFSLSLSPT